MPPVVKKTVIPNHPKSRVWGYFGDSEDGQTATCLLCKYTKKGATNIKVCNGSTQALRNHMKYLHKKEYEEMEKKEMSEVKTVGSKKAENTPKISEAFNKMIKVDPLGKKQSTYDKKLLEFLASKFIPFEVVNSEEFANFVMELDRSINLKTANTYSRQLSDLSEEVLLEVKKLVDEYCTASAAITTDLWTSRMRDSYISITLHFVDELFRLHRWTPFCSLFSDKHTGENIAEVVDLDLSDKLDLASNMPKWGVADNASNMVKALNSSIVDLYTCCCHTQQLAISDAFKSFKDTGDNESMLDKSTKCQKLAAHLKRADNSRKLLHSECTLAGHKPNAIPVGNDTRWDSVYDCMKGVLYHQPCLLKMAQAGHLRFEDSNGITTDLVPSINDFRVIEAGVEILEKCKVTTKIFEQEKVPTLPLVTERLYTVDQELKEFMQNDNNKRNKRKAVVFARILREKLSSRFPQFGTDRFLNCMGNLLNPSLKGVHLKLVDKFEQTKRLMEEKLGEWMGEELVRPIEEESEDDGRSPPAKLSVTEMLKRRMQQEEEKRGGVRSSEIFSEQKSKFEKECSSYELMPFAETGTDQLLWWKDHQHQFPLLSYLARVVFAIPAASSKSERVFSVAGNVVTPKRGRLNPAKVEDLIIVKCNMQLLREYGRKM